MAAPVRPSYELYELWTFLALRRLLEPQLPGAEWGEEGVAALSLFDEHPDKAVDIGYRARWPGRGTLRLLFNPTFPDQCPHQPLFRDDSSCAATIAPSHLPLVIKGESPHTIGRAYSVAATGDHRLTEQPPWPSQGEQLSLHIQTPDTVWQGALHAEAHREPCEMELPLALQQQPGPFALSKSRELTALVVGGHRPVPDSTRCWAAPLWSHGLKRAMVGHLLRCVRVQPRAEHTHSLPAKLQHPPLLAVRQISSQQEPSLSEV